MFVIPNQAARHPHGSWEALVGEHGRILPALQGVSQIWTAGNKQMASIGHWMAERGVFDYLYLLHFFLL